MASKNKSNTYDGYICPDQLPPVKPKGRRKKDPDEKFFIRTHQAFEIWFAQILEELEFARTLLSTDYVPEHDIPPIEHHVRRAAEIFNLIRDHLPLLETLQTTSFYDFRSQLFGSSGRDSYRFREVEWLMGFLDPKLEEYVSGKVEFEKRLMEEKKRLPGGKVPKNDKGGSRTQNEVVYPTRDEQEFHSLLDYRRTCKNLIENLDILPPELESRKHALKNRLRDLDQNGTLRSKVVEWLDRTVFPSPGGKTPPRKSHSLHFSARFQEIYLKAYSNDLKKLGGQGKLHGDHRKRLKAEASRKIDLYFRKRYRCAIVFTLQFADQPLLAWPASLIEALLELDQAFSNFRDRHIAMVARVLGGGRISTHGEEGSGIPYLQKTLAKRVFPELWDARTFLLSHEEAQDVYKKREKNWGEWKYHRLVYERPPR